jgi:acyl-CoA synthetase (NDP forming)
MMSPPQPRLSLREILHPRSVAVFGASEDKGKFGGRILHYLKRHGFAGSIVPINPKRDEILGLRCYPTIAAAPGPIDVAVLAVPPASIADTVAFCAEAGVGCCVVITTGFAEAGVEGEALQRSIVATANSAGMRIIGPNCMGLMNLHHDFCLTSSLVLEVDRLHKGAIGLVSQSGALMVSMFNRAHDAAIGFSACVSLGNQSDVEICDVFEYFIADSKTRVICMYIEGLKDGGRFLALAERSRAAGKPVLVVKTGRTEAGVRAARSHTASLAGAYEVFAAACHERDVLLTDDPDGMIAAADIVQRWGAPRGDGIGLLSSSGGGAGIGIDRLGEARLRAATLSEGTRARLLEVLLPPQADNPIDLGGRRGGESVAAAGDILSRFAADDDVSVLFIVLTTVPFYEATTRALAEAALASGKPTILAVTPGSAADAPREVLRSLAFPYYDRIDDALRVLTLYLAYWKTRSRLARQPAARRRDLPTSIAAPSGQLTEHETKKLLAAYGIRVTREAAVRSREEAIEAARIIGFPVVLKASARGLIHKSDAGAVKLNLADAEQVGGAWDDIEAVVRRLVHCSFEGGLVEEMVRDGLELIVGAKLDPQFGPIVLVGMGGVLVELLGDVQMASAPVTTDEALAMLRRLKLWPLLDGYRGRAKFDSVAAADVVSRVSWLATDLAPRLQELDINPLIVLSDGAIAVDARALVFSAGTTDAAP